MLEDLKTLFREFDLMALINPNSVEQFMMNLVFLLIIVGLIVVAWKVVQHFLGG